MLSVICSSSMDPLALGNTYKVSLRDERINGIPENVRLGIFSASEQEMFRKFLRGKEPRKRNPRCTLSIYNITLHRKLHGPTYELTQW